MDTPRAVLLVFVLVFLFITPDRQQSSPTQQLELQQLLLEERYALDSLNSSQYGDLDAANNKWVNVTGLRKDDGFVWDLLPQVQVRAREQVRDILGSWEQIEYKNPKDAGLGSRYKSIESIDRGPLSGNYEDFKNQVIPFYQNITGIIRGEWVRSKAGTDREPPILNLTAFAPRLSYSTNELGRNITGSGGDLRIKLEEKKSEVLRIKESSVREVRAEMVIADEASSGDGWVFALYGVHYPESGAVLLSTSSKKFAGIFALPYFARSEPAFLLAQQLLNRTLMASIVEQEASILSAPSFPWASSTSSAADILSPTPYCEYIVYLQQHAPEFLNEKPNEFYRDLAGLQMLENELRFPTGATLAVVPAMKMSAVIFSPDCGFVLESKGPPEYPQHEGQHLRGPKLEQYIYQVKRYILVFAGMVCAQLFLLTRQMKDASTPSTRSRVSFYTIAISLFGDGFICLCSMGIGLYVDGLFLILLSTAFIALLSVTFVGMNLLKEIWKVQAPERQERERREAVNQPLHQNAPVVVITPAGADSLPLPVTAPRPTDSGATPIILPPDQDLGALEVQDNTAIAQPTTQTTLGNARREIGALYSRFYFLLFAYLFMSIWAASWPRRLRSLYTNTSVFIYLSFWVPQIHRNIVRNCRKALRWEFVVGQSILRLAPLLYIYAVEDNILFARTDQHAAYVLSGWVWVQVWALVSQEIFGPRFFVPNGWAPPAYDYHPVLRDGDEEAGILMPIGFTQATSTDGLSSASTSGEPLQNGQRVFNCAICMQGIDVPVERSREHVGGEVASSLGGGLFGRKRRSYMITPCRHIFHSACLEGWMRYRLQCPICREVLPPL